MLTRDAAPRDALELLSEPIGDQTHASTSPPALQAQSAHVACGGVRSEPPQPPLDEPVPATPPRRLDARDDRREQCRQHQPRSQQLTSQHAGERGLLACGACVGGRRNTCELPHARSAPARAGDRPPVEEGPYRRDNFTVWWRLILRQARLAVQAS